MKTTTTVATLTATLITFGALTGGASAIITVSDASYTANSITFNVSGDFSGYDTFSETSIGLRYTGDLVSVPLGDFVSNVSWSGSFIDGGTIFGGNTGNFNGVTFPDPYSWSQAPAVSNSSILVESTITLTTSADIFNLNASDTTVVLTAGNPGFSDIELATFNAVPEPSSTLLLGLGALGFTVRRRRSN